MKINILLGTLFLLTICLSHMDRKPVKEVALSLSPGTEKIIISTQDKNYSIVLQIDSAGKLSEVLQYQHAKPIGSEIRFHQYQANSIVNYSIDQSIKSKGPYKYWTSYDSYWMGETGIDTLGAYLDIYKSPLSGPTVLWGKQGIVCVKNYKFDDHSGKILKNGYFYFFNPSGRITREVEYRNDSIISANDYIYQ